MENFCIEQREYKQIIPPKTECLNSLSQRFKELNGMSLSNESLWQKLLSVLYFNLDKAYHDKLSTFNILDYANACLNLRLDPLLVEYVQPVFLDIYNKLIPRPTLLGFQSILFTSDKIRGFEFEEGPLNKNALSSFVKCFIYHVDFDKPLIGMAYPLIDANDEKLLHNLAFMRAVRLSIGSNLIAIDDFPYVKNVKAKKNSIEKIEVKPKNVENLFKEIKDKSDFNLNKNDQLNQVTKTLSCDGHKDINQKQDANRTKKLSEAQKIQEIFGGSLFF